jgi:hypothetical protein
MPLLTIASAVASIRLSLMLCWKVFQEFHPIGGTAPTTTEEASPPPLPSSAPAVASVALGASARASAMPDAPPSDDRALALVELVPPLVSDLPVEVAELPAPPVCVDLDDAPLGATLEDPSREPEGPLPFGDEHAAKHSSVHATHRTAARRRQLRIVMGPAGRSGTSGLRTSRNAFRRAGPLVGGAVMPGRKLS